MHVLGVISTSAEPNPRCAVAIGTDALDLAKYAKTGKLSHLEAGHNYTFEKLFSEVRSYPMYLLGEVTDRISSLH